MVQVHFSGNHSAELNRIKVDKVHHIIQVDVVQLYYARVCFRLTNLSVGSQELLLMLEEEMIDAYRTVVDSDFRRMHVPHRIVQDYRAGLQIYLRQQLSFSLRLLESSLSFQVSAESRRSIVAPV